MAEHFDISIDRWAARSGLTDCWYEEWEVLFCHPGTLYDSFVSSSLQLLWLSSNRWLTTSTCAGPCHIRYLTTARLVDGNASSSVHGDLRDLVLIKKKIYTVSSLWT